MHLKFPNSYNMYDGCRHNVAGLVSATTDCMNCVKWRRNMMQDCGMSTLSCWVAWAKIRS